jgi:alkaline phosphatase D
MTIDRRRALGLLGLGAAAIPGTSEALSLAAVPGARFTHGVAAGDPLHDRAVLWTRILPEDPSAATRWLVRCEIAEDPEFRTLARAPLGRLRPDRDWTVKIDARGLRPGRDYWYRFVTGEARSPVGRFRTLPVGPTPDVVMATVSCALWSSGLFNVYEALSREERLDAVICLGDYIYEYGGASGDYGMNVGGQKIGRIPDPPHETVTLDDYRRRHAQAKSDPDLQAAHARAAWICVYDDHELTNDPWQGGAQNHNPDKGEGAWADRKAAALRAFYEWMPIREPRPGRTREEIYRSFRFGDLAALHMLESRLLARSEQLEYELDDVESFRRRLNDPARRLLGQKQLDWLGGQLRRARSDRVAWQVLGQQIVMAQVQGPDLVKAAGQAAVDKGLAGITDGRRRRIEAQLKAAALGLPMNLDAWDGYPAERARLYRLLRDAGPTVVLSGDVHCSWANTLHDDAGAPVAVEFVGSAVSSPRPSFSTLVPGLPIDQIVIDQNPDVDWMESEPRGYVKLTFTRAEARAEFVGVSTVMAKPYRTRLLKAFTARANGAGVPSLAAV